MHHYLVICDGHEPFITEWFDSENNFNPDLNMVVVNLLLNTYTKDGKEWHDIKIDHL